jgi:hypothetical protein
MKNIDLVMIDWLDAYVTHNEDMELEADCSHFTRSIGWLVKKDKDFLYLSHFFDGISGEFSSPYTAIPKGMVKEKWILEIQ